VFASGTSQRTMQHTLLPHTPISAEVNKASVVENRVDGLAKRSTYCAWAFAVESYLFLAEIVGRFSSASAFKQKQGAGAVYFELFCAEITWWRDANMEFEKYQEPGISACSLLSIERQRYEANSENCTIDLDQYFCGNTSYIRRLDAL
jgi:hypothetical protein